MVDKNYIQVLILSKSRTLNHFFRTFKFDVTWCATKRKRQNNSGFCKSKPNQQTAWKTYRKWFQMKSVNARLSEPPPTSPRIHIFSDCCQLWYYLSIHSFCTLSQLIIFSLLVLYCGIVLWYTTSTKCLYTCSKMYVLLSFPIHSLSIFPDLLSWKCV